MSESKHPYIECPTCQAWFQHPMPVKKYEAKEEKGPDGRTQIPDERTLNGSAALATLWYKNWLEPRWGSNQVRALDVGCKYPYFSYTLKQLGAKDVYAIDGMDFDTPNQEAVTPHYQESLQVPMLMMDFEITHTNDILAKCGGLFHGISLIHVFEHFYLPRAALLKLSDLMIEGGVLLLRFPDHGSPNKHLHLSPQHYQVHPYYYDEFSFRNTLTLSRAPFRVEQTYPIPASASRDFILIKDSNANR